ncbi:dihydropteroate synthase [Niastella yeongjuensis]|uniref:dihydropteroate synthase n=1 Tax=Niastella yeongjuensis TaxID=354355 RepID=A0A1V9E428_9BACT|nr:dihydropteroate synthase [Niastella yeongjuensis]OQP40887.1 dihydropteroate synthase [Niastella yeongjuensis]SEO98866.1 dihydropteroate synthase [Niastella yeongjuensis]
MYTLNCKGRLLVIDKPLVMGIINTTPDSFYEGSRFMGESGVLKQAEEMLKAGADILDIGGQSTRPNSITVSAGEELQRVTGAIESLHYNFPEAVISIDTYYARVAAEAVAAGASIVNDVSAGLVDPAIITTTGSLRVPYICTHIKGTPATMQQHATYDNVTREVLDFFIQKTAECHKAGITDVIIDPGFGFAKTPAHNFVLLKDLALLKMLDKPILVGVSRKSSVYKTLGITAAEALNGTTVLNTVGLLNGAHILRVHDVKEAKEAITLVSRL